MRATTLGQGQQRGEDERSTATEARIRRVSSSGDLDDRWDRPAAGGRVRLMDAL